MHIKLVAVCLVLFCCAAIGLAPGQASAEPLLEDPFGRLKGGSLIDATNEGNIVLSGSLGNITCQESTLTGTVDSNVGLGFLVSITKAMLAGTGANTHCTSNIIFNPTFTVDTAESLPWCLTSEGDTDNWTVRGGGCTSAAKELTFTLTGPFTCKYKRATVTGIFNTTLSPATLKVGAGQAFTREEGGGLCAESLTLSGAWQLYTDIQPTTHDGSTAVTVHDV